MNDFIVGLIIGGVGSYIMGQLDQSNTIAQQQKSCAANGGVWVESVGEAGGVCNPANCANPCLQENSVATQYQPWGLGIDMGAPVAAAFLATRSLPGALGGGIGSLALLLTELGSIKGGF